MAYGSGQVRSTFEEGAIDYMGYELARMLGASPDTSSAAYYAKQDWEEMAKRCEKMAKKLNEE